MPGDQAEVSEYRTAPGHGVAYSKKEFDDWFGGLDEWHAAPPKGKPDKLKALLLADQRQQGHDFLMARGVTEAKDRERIMDKHVPEKARPKPPREPVDDTERFPLAAEAIKQGQVAFVTYADAELAPFVANAIASYDAMADGEVGLVGQVVPLTVYTSDASTAERLRAACGAKMGPGAAARLAELDSSDGSLDALTASQRRQLCQLKVMRTALASHPYAVYVDGPTSFERPGGVAACVERLVAAAEDDRKAAELAASKARVAATAPSPPVVELVKPAVPLPPELHEQYVQQHERRAKEAAAKAARDGGGGAQQHDESADGDKGAASRGVELLLPSAGLSEHLKDSTLGQEWVKVVTKPADEDGRLLVRNKALAKALQAGKVSYSRSELAAYGMRTLWLDSYIEVGAGSTLSWYRPSGHGLSTAWMAARSTPRTLALFTVDKGMATRSPDWNAAAHVNAQMLNSVAHDVLQLRNFPNAQFWPPNKERFESKQILPTAKPFVVLFDRLQGIENRRFIESNDRWLIGGACDLGEEGEDEEDVVIC
jgi:hypothetical protein